MTDFTTLAGVHGYRTAFPAVFTGMDDDAVGPVVEAVHSGVLEGWEPTSADVQGLVDRHARPGASSLTDDEVEEFVALVTSGVGGGDARTPRQATSPATPPAPQPDVWRSYFYPNSTVLRNLPGIRDGAHLDAVEHAVATGRGLALAAGELSVEGTTSGERLSSIHRSLFGQLYPWAGEYRVVNMMKGPHGFGDHHSMDMYLRQLDRKIAGVDWDGASFDGTVDALADVHTDLNFAHPFRDGNGRASRLFMADLARQHGVDLHFNRVNCSEWTGASSATFLDPSGIRTDSTPMRAVYHRVASPRG